LLGTEGRSLGGYVGVWAVSLVTITQRHIPEDWSRLRQCCVNLNLKSCLLGVVHTATQHSALYPLGAQPEGPHALMSNGSRTSRGKITRVTPNHLNYCVGL